MHSTTSRHDDWLHRGPFLADLPWLVYMMRVQRVRKPLGANADYSQLFFFDDHYTIGVLYCQQIQYCTQLAIPRIVGSVCPPMEEDGGEAHARYKLILFSRTRCPGRLACADPMLFRSSIFPSDDPDSTEIAHARLSNLKAVSKALAQGSRTQRRAFLPAWRACRCEFEIKAQTAMKKEHCARKIAVVADTTTMKDRGGNSDPAVRRAISLRPDLLKMMARYFDKNTQQMPYGLVQLVDLISCFVCGQSCYHCDEQLHLVEFAALQMKEYNDAVDMDLLVRKKPFREEEQQGGFVNDVDSDVEDSAAAKRLHSEFLGGGGDSDCDHIEDTEGDLTLTYQAIIKFSLEQCKAMLARSKEIERASAPGRTKEADAQMKAYSLLFHCVMQLALVSAPAAAMASLPLHHAANFQRAIAKEMRVQETSSSGQGDDDINLNDLLQLQARNEAADNEHCVSVPLEDVLRGPGHVAWKLIQDLKAGPDNNFEFNDEQISIISLLTWLLEQAWRTHLQGKLVATQAGATVNTLRKLPNDLGLPRVVIIGGGGCGKTTIMQLVIVPMLRIFFERIVLTAPSNRAARGFDQSAKTLHSIAGMKPQDSMRTSSLGIKSDQMRKRMENNQTYAGAWIHDEALQTAASLLHAVALRTTYARQHIYKLDIARYAAPSEIMGKMSFFVMCGDHLQLPPVPKSSGLLASLEGTSDEHKVGASMFNRVHYLFEMHTMKRFEDPVLVSILQKMRHPGGKQLLDNEWEALLATELDAIRDPEEFVRDTAGWFESSYLWSVVSMACYTRATISARQAQQILFYCQAVDVRIRSRNKRGHHVSRLKLMTLQSRTFKRFHMGYLG